MNVLHLLVKGEAGGIESLCRDYANYSSNKNVFAFLKGVDSVNAVKMKKSGHTVIELNYSSKKAIGVWKNLNKQIKLYSIEVIVVHHASPILYLFAWGLKLKNSYLKIVAYAHCEAEDMLSGSGKLSIKDKIIVNSFVNSDKVIAISSAVRSSLIECFGLQKNKICVVHNGVDLSRFKSNYNCEMHNPIRLLYVGRLVKEKGVQNILLALSKLSEKIDNWSFDIVGEGEYRNNLEEYTKKLGLTRRVRFLGTRDDIPEILEKHDIFVHMPAYEEGFGITIIEAMAAGLVCVCAGRGGIPEIIENNISGILVYSNQELCDALTKIFMCKDQEIFSEIRRSAIRRAEDFDIKIFSKNLDTQLLLI